MNKDFWRFTGVILVSIVTGWVTHQVVICLIAGLVIYIYWQHQVLEQLLHWLQRRKENDPPELPGLIDEICREIDYLRERHKQRKNKLSGFLKRFQEATSALPDAVVVMGQYGVIEWANDKAREYLGIRWPQDSRQRISNLIRHPELMQFLTDKERHNSNKGLQLDSPVNLNQKLEFRIIPYGKTQKLLVARDVTALARTNRMRRDFIANASHELRTPLTVISGYLEGFEDETDEFSRTRKNQIARMRKQTGRMQRLIDDLLNLASLESKPEYADKNSIVKVPELLKGIHQDAATLSGMMQHIFYIESDPKLWIRGKRGELYSAFSNLVFNAVQYTSERGVIRIRWYADDDGAHFEVIDNGEGIAPEHIDRLTERFYRVDKGRSREKGGTGLGLAIVKHVLIHHNGHLHIESTPGKGSTFRCDFPADIIVRELDSTAESSRS